MCCSYSISVSRMVRRDYQQPLDWSWEESWHNVQMPPNMAKEQRVARITPGQSLMGVFNHTYKQISLSAWREFCVEFLEVAIARARFVAL